jgi:hypothetical protein
MRVLLWLVALLALSCGAAKAGDSGWVRMTAAEFADYQFSRGDIRLDYFTLAEQSSWMSDELRVLKLSLAGVNKGSDPVNVVVQLIAFDRADQPLFVITAEPGFSQLSPGQVEDFSGDVYVAPGEFAQVASYLVRSSGSF